MDRFAATPAPASAARLLEAVRGATFDDFLLAPQLGVLEHRDPAVVDLGARVSRGIALARPIVSANMDTVTRAAMAIAQAEEGGLGIIDRGFRPGEIEEQAHEVRAVKRTQHAIIPDPWTIAADAGLGEARREMAAHRVGTLVVIDGAGCVAGILTERDVRFVGNESVRARMTPVERLVLHRGPVAAAEAEGIMAERKVKKLPLIDAGGRLLGLVTAKDLLKNRRMPFATRDDHGRLRVGAAIGATGDYLERAAELLRVGADLIVIDIAHGHSAVMDKALAAFRRRFPDAQLVAGNVATAAGARFLAERGADGIKVGIGPGGGCTTRLGTGFGVPQAQAIAECRAAVGWELPVIADGGIRRNGALALALALGADCAMLGSAFAGTAETPGEIVHKRVLLAESHKSVEVPFKVLRGMASLPAVRDRLAVEDLETLGAEGLETSVPARGSVRPVLQEMVRHLCSAVSYGGAASLSELRARLWAEPERYLIRLTEAARRESFER